MTRGVTLIATAARRSAALLLLLLGVGVALPATAVIDLHAFETPEQEARFAGLIDELRCPKCLNTNLSGSDSPIAADLRRTVARMIREGHTDQQIRDYLLERYGDFILYRPRLTAGTAVLWFAPGLLLLVGLTVIVVMVRRQLGGHEPTDLSDADAQRLAVLRGDAGQQARGSNGGNPPRSGPAGKSASEPTP